MGCFKQYFFIDVWMFGKCLYVQQQMVFFDSLCMFFYFFCFDSIVIEYVFDELEYLGFMVSYFFFEFFKINFWGLVLVKDFVVQVGCYICIVGYLFCIKDVFILKGMMNYGIWIDVVGQLFDSVYFFQ